MLSLSGQLPLKGLEEAKRAEEKTQSKEKGEGETNAGRPDPFCFFTSAPFGALDTDVRTRACNTVFKNRRPPLWKALSLSSLKADQTLHPKAVTWNRYYKLI